MEYRPGLNQVTPLEERMRAAFEGATRAHLGVAYAKTSGVSRLLRLRPPDGSRAVVGLGFGVTDPQAVEQLEHAGLDVRVVADGSALSASQFHPKLYLVERPGELVTLSGSANLTGAGWTSNVEQFEELLERDPSAGADAQRARFEKVWDHGSPLQDSAPQWRLGPVPAAGTRSAPARTRGPTTAGSTAGPHRSTGRPAHGPVTRLRPATSPSRTTSGGSSSSASVTAPTGPCSGGATPTSSGRSPRVACCSTSSRTERA